MHGPDDPNDAICHSMLLNFLIQLNNMKLEREADMEREKFLEEIKRLVQEKRNE